MEQVFEDVAINGNRIIINRNSRCVNCNAYQVIEYTKTGIEQNLSAAKSGGHDVLICKDDEECHENKIADQTKVTVITEELPGGKPRISGYQVFAPNGEMMEVDFAPEKKP